MQYDVYHDESKEGGYWHGMLLVPSSTRGRLLEHLGRAREAADIHSSLGIKGLKKRNGGRFRCIRAWISIAVASLCQSMKAGGCQVYTGSEDPECAMDVVDSLIGAKFILFRVRDGHRTLTLLSDYAAKVETTFRMGLKGGLNLFANTGSVIEISSLHFDGHRHYQRRLDKKRIVGRIGPVNSKIHLARDLPIWDESGDHNRPDSQPYSDCQLLQLTDLLVGGFRTVLGDAKNEAQAEVSYPLRSLAERWNRGPARMRNSRWHGGFCISECYLDETDNWQFSGIRSMPSEQQGKLF